MKISFRVQNSWVLALSKIVIDFIQTVYKICLLFIDRQECTGTCFIQKMYAPSSSLLQGASIFFAYLWSFRWPIISLHLEIFLFSTATFKYTYRGPVRGIGQEYSANVASSTFQSLKRIQSLPVCARFFHMHSEFSWPAMCNNAIMIISSQM